MNNDKLRAELESLHNELQNAEALDPQQRELLKTRAEDINDLLARDENGPDQYRSLSERLSEDLAQLEASHPQLTLLMRRAIDSLAVLGI
jgi:hypothetical protein